MCIRIKRKSVTADGLAGGRIDVHSIGEPYHRHSACLHDAGHSEHSGSVHAVPHRLHSPSVHDAALNAGLGAQCRSQHHGVVRNHDERNHSAAARRDAARSTGTARRIHHTAFQDGIGIDHAVRKSHTDGSHHSDGCRNSGRGHEPAAVDRRNAGHDSFGNQHSVRTGHDRWFSLWRSLRQASWRTILLAGRHGIGRRFNRRRVRLRRLPRHGALYLTGHRHHSHAGHRHHIRHANGRLAHHDT